MYFDSSIWISTLIPDIHSPSVTPLTERVEKGQDVVVISSLVLLEVIDVIRKRITEKESYTGLTQSAKTTIEAKARTKVKDFIDKATKLETQGKAMILDPDMPLQDYETETLKLSRSHFGEVLDSSTCPVCRRSLATRYRYKGIGHYDIQHAINACGSKASELCTCDKAFEQINSFSKFSTLRVSVV